MFSAAGNSLIQAVAGVIVVGAYLVSSANG